MQNHNSSAIAVNLQSSSLPLDRGWIRSPAFDLLFVFGGSVFTLAIACITFVEPILLPIAFWLWIIAFEGSHFWPTISRTYIDKKFRSEHNGALVGSLVFFLFPLAAVLHDRFVTGVSMMLLYGFFIFVWSLYHNARQHYGFLSIYSGKSKLDANTKSSFVRLLYLGTCAAQAHFLLNFKGPGAFGLTAASSVNLNFIIQTIPMIITAVAFVSLIWVAIKSRALIPALYVGTCLIFYSSMFYFIAPLDLFVQSPSGAQTLMLVTIMNSLFHNIQYHAIVWHYGQSRFASTEDREAKMFGVAHAVNSKTFNYGLVALAMGLAFGFIVWNLADWPNYSGQFTMANQATWAYVLFFGIIGHHFFLDQKIWRPSVQKDLKGYLKLL